MSFIYTAAPSIATGLAHAPPTSMYTSLPHTELKLEQKTIDEIESRIRDVASKQRKPMIKRETIAVPGPEGRRIKLVRRLPTPLPDVVERTYVIKPQKDEINIIVERPNTPPSQFVSKTIVEEPGLPDVTHQIVKVPARNIPREINLADYVEEKPSKQLNGAEELVVEAKVLATPVPSVRVQSRQPSVVPTQQTPAKSATPTEAAQTPVKQRTPSVTTTTPVPVKSRTPSVSATPIAVQSPIKRTTPPQSLSQASVRQPSVVQDSESKQQTPQPIISQTVSVEILKTPSASGNPTPLPSSPVKQMVSQTPVQQQQQQATQIATPVQKTRTPSVTQSASQTPLKQNTPVQSVPQTPIKQTTPIQSVPQTPIKQELTQTENVPQTPVKQVTPVQSSPQTPVKQVTPAQSIPQTPVQQPIRVLEEKDETELVSKTRTPSVSQTPIRTPLQSVPQTPKATTPAAQHLTRTPSLINNTQRDATTVVSRQSSVILQQSAKPTPTQSQANVTLTSSLKQIFLTPEDVIVPIVQKSATSSTSTIRAEAQPTQVEVKQASQEGLVYYSIPLNIVSANSRTQSTKSVVSNKQGSVENTPFPIQETTQVAQLTSAQSSYSSLKSSFAAASATVTNANTSVEQTQLVHLPSPSNKPSKSGSLLSVYGLFKQ